MVMEMCHIKKMLRYKIIIKFNKLIYMKKHRFYLPSFFSFLFFVFCSFSSSGQKSTNTTVKDSTSIISPKYIPTINVIDKIEVEKESIKNIYKNLDQNKGLTLIDSLLPIYTSFIKIQKESTENFIEANPNRLKINILIKKWQGYVDYLKIWQLDINSYAKHNTELHENIVFNHKTWKLTYENSIKEKIPYEVLKNVKTVLNDISNLEKTITHKNNDLLKLESKISKQIVNSKDVITQLNELKNSNVYNLFYLRHKPLWQVSFAASKNQKIRKENSESITKNLHDFISLLKNSEEQLNLFTFLIILISVFVMYLKRNLKKSKIFETGFDVNRAKNNLIDFTLTTILFATVVVAKYTFINTPRLFDDFLSIIILFSIIPLIKRNLNSYYYKALYIIVALYILDLTKTYLWLTTAQYKIYLFALSLMVLSITFFIKLDRVTLRKMKIGFFSKYLQKLIPALYLLGAVAIFSNILGYTNLTETTIKFCISGGVVTMLFYYILLIINSISVVIIQRHYHRKIGYDVKQKKKNQRKASKIIRFIMSVLGIIIFLKTLDVLSYIIQFSNEILSSTYKIGDLEFTLGSILSFLLILSGSYIITKLISFTFGETDKLFNLIKLPKGVPAAISLVVRYFIFAFGIILALSSLGVDLSKFNLMAGALGLGIGFGLQTVISNFVSGLILVFERPILPGDIIEVDNLMGTVNRIGVRSSSISTFDGAEVIVPNNNLISKNLINWTLSDSIKRIEINIGTTYKADPNKVIEILKEAALSSEKVLRSPAPLPLLNDFGESSLNFKLRFWVHNENGLSAKSDVSITIYNKFKENNIEIPYPHQDIYIKDIPKNIS